MSKDRLGNEPVQQQHQEKKNKKQPLYVNYMLKANMPESYRLMRGQRQPATVEAILLPALAVSSPTLKVLDFHSVLTKPVLIEIKVTDTTAEVLLQMNVVCVQSAR